MFTRFYYAISTAALLGVVFTSAAIALPANPVVPSSPDGGAVKVHGCHRSCELGPVIGWHRHGVYCRPIACAPLAPHPHRCWIDWAGVRHCVW